MLLTDSVACLRADRLGLLISGSLALTVFSGVLAVLVGPGGFLFIMFPVFLKFSTHRRIVLLRNGPVSANIELSTKELLRCCDRLVTSNKAVVSEQTML